MFGTMASFVELWQKKMSPDHRLPSRSDFDFFDFHEFWGRVSVAEVRRDPFDIYFRLWGSSLVDWWGTDYTNRLLSEETVTPVTWAEAESQYFERLSVGDSFGFFTGTLDDYGRGHVRVLGVDLPLAKDGIVTHILSTYQREDFHGPISPTEKALYTY